MIKAGFTEEEMSTKLQRIGKDRLVPTDWQVASGGAHRDTEEGGHRLPPT